MNPTKPSRREFLQSSAHLLGGSWLVLGLPGLAALSACARDAAERGEPLTHLSAAEGRTLAAFSDRILPPDDLPGAVDAHVPHFVDRALGDYFADLEPPVRAGLADLDRRAAERGAEGFADLSEAAQVEVMRAVEDTPFFGMTRMLVIAGMFGDPERGGNRDGAGWKVMGMTHAAAFEPPFGHYDAALASTDRGGTE